MSALAVLIHGARGRMGRAVVAACAAEPAVRVAAEVDQGDDLAAALPGCDAVIDFSHPSAAPGLAAACAAARKVLVVGTTGHSAAESDAIRAAAGAVPVVFAPNFSVGVNTLFWLAARAAAALGPAFDVEVVEMHHRLKKDAPSGTARRLAEILAAARGTDYATAARHGREGMVGERTSAEIGIHALRGGDVVGDHTAVFAAPGERVELTHKASSRDTFAAGAVRAALWARAQRPGLYDMQDVLGLR